MLAATPALERLRAVRYDLRGEAEQGKLTPDHLTVDRIILGNQDQRSLGDRLLAVGDDRGCTVDMLARDRGTLRLDTTERQRDRVDQRSVAHEIEIEGGESGTAQPWPAAMTVLEHHNTTALTPLRAGFELFMVRNDVCEHDPLIGIQPCRSPGELGKRRHMEDDRAFGREVVRHVGRTPALHADDLMALFDQVHASAFAHPVLVLDCLSPSVNPISVATLVPDLPQGSSIVLWGASAALEAEVVALGQGQGRFIRCEGNVSPGDVASLVRALLGN